ncbi:phospholipase C, phosphocholine-specific [Williamsia maris]
MQLSGGVAAATFLSDSIARAADIPAARTTGTLADVEHIVVLMQENRSFDHYFGSMRGVRGFGDPHPAKRRDGKSVWFQSDGSRDIAPFHPDHDDLGLTFIEDLDHSWAGGHRAFNSGHYDQWIPAKTPTTMAHLLRDDMPFHHALADAFTVCDNYHCSLLGPTDPNRYYMWTGWVGNDGRGGGPVIDNAEKGYDWSTYPERLEKAGVSWKIYQDSGTGLDAAGSWGYAKDPYVGNYGDNSLLYFNRYRTAASTDALYAKARVGTQAASGGDASLFDGLRRDVKAGSLPKIAWIVAPEAYTEHPSWPVNYGAWYIANVLNALTSDPDTWARTALLITYDENDGFFDHIVPPHPHGAGVPGDSTVSTVDEVFSGRGTDPAGAYGLGQRVPMMVISPWSSGGWVCSEVFDHTSILRLMEKRFGVREPNITPWRRSVCGDLTSAFDFTIQKSAVPRLPATAGYRPDHVKHPDYRPAPPAVGAVPVQERGSRPSRGLAYRLATTIAVTPGSADLTVVNAGSLGAHFQVRSAALPVPHSFTVGAGATLRASVPANQIAVHGPNGFFREVRGTAKGMTIAEKVDGAALRLTITNSTAEPFTVTITEHGGVGRSVVVPADGRTGYAPVLDHGWYSVEVRLADHVRTLAGRVETGAHGISDPRIGGS